MSIDRKITRTLKKGDESRVIELHHHAFGSDINMELWEWKYRKQPQGDSLIAVAEIDGEIVGHQGMIRNHLNYTGRELLAAQAGDS